ncbi:MAG: ABC transporter substrate-binding protein [Thermoleophilaceae bacterium]
MPHIRTRLVVLMLVALASALLVAACGGDDDDSGGSNTGSSGSEPQPGSLADLCPKDRLDLVKSGQLTVGTDKPAFPPYFEDDDPTNGKGFESAVAYAVAKKLGFSKSEVKWTVVPFNSSYAPGPKDFDFDINQISITPARQKAVDFSDPYYTAPQAVVLAKGSDLKVGSLSDLKDAEIGVQIGTTSLDAVNSVIMPSKDPKVFNDSNDVVTALKQNQVDAVVTDLPTAFYITAAQVPGSKIAGQFATGEGDTWGLLLAKDSKITPCVDKVIGDLTESGELKKLEERWMGAAAGAPELKP